MPLSVPSQLAKDNYLHQSTVSRRTTWQRKMNQMQQMQMIIPVCPLCIPPPHFTNDFEDAAVTNQMPNETLMWWSGCKPMAWARLLRLVWKLSSMFPKQVAQMLPFFLFCLTLLHRFLSGKWFFYLFWNGLQPHHIKSTQHGRHELNWTELNQVSRRNGSTSKTTSQQFISRPSVLDHCGNFLNRNGSLSSGHNAWTTQMDAFDWSSKTTTENNGGPTTRDLPCSWLT